MLLAYAAVPGLANMDVRSAQLIALFCESMVFGAFAVLYAIAIWILLYREKRRSKSTLNKMLFGTSTFMFVLSVAVRTILSFLLVFSLAELFLSI